MLVWAGVDLAAPMSTGKSCIKRPIDICLKDIVAHDNLCREQEQLWKDEQNSRAANKKGTERPKDICVQVVDSDMTNAAFTQRLADAERAGHKCLYTRMDEIEMLSKLAGGSSKEMVSRIICHNFDTDMYGQERVGAQSVTARVPMRWCCNASTTPASAIRYFRKNVNDGTVSRIDFCTIPEIEDNGEIPVYKRYDEKFEQQMAVYQQLLQEASGTIVCQQAKKMAVQLCKLAVERAALFDDDHAHPARQAQSQPQGPAGTVDQARIHRLLRGHEEVSENPEVSLKPCGLRDIFN